MLAELTIIPLGRVQHVSSAIAPAISLTETSGLPFQLTPSGTCIEGDWDRVRQSSSHVITVIKIEDEEGEHQKLSRNVSSVEEITGRRTAITGETPPSHRERHRVL